MLQALLSILTSFLVYRIACRLRGERAGLAAGTFVAFYPSHVAFSHLLWAETLFLLLVTAALHQLLATDERGCLRSAVLAGLILGLATLVRSVGVVLLAASVLWIVSGRRPAGGHVYRYGHHRDGAPCCR